MSFENKTGPTDGPTNDEAPVTVACTLRAPGATWSTPWGCVLTQDQTTAKPEPQAEVWHVVDDPNFSYSRVLGGNLPSISPSESSLLRAKRSTLAQLRSGQCHLLQDYQQRIDKPTSAVCPETECRYRRHTVSHLFSCNTRPTGLSTRDLWINPVTAVTFLRTLPSFSSLATIDAVPAPRPPPEPPP